MTDIVRQRILHLLWTLALVAALTAVPLLNRSAAPGVTAGATEPHRSEALARYGFRLDEVSRKIGVDAVHQGPTFDPRLEPIMPQVASMGAAVAVADFDRDGWQDFYVTNSAEGSLNHLYRNQGNGTFKDVAAEMGVADVNRAGTGVSMGAVWGDYDNDGYEDLFWHKYGRPELFHNEKGRGFVPVGERAGLPRWVNANSAVWFDYDGDGLLDLFLAGYWPESVDLWKLATTRIMPESFEYAENGGRKYVFHNRGDGTFEEVSASLGIDSRRWTLATSAADLSGTGHPDLFLANDYGISQLYANRNGKRFEEVGRETGVGRLPKSGMNAAFGDVFNDGRLSIYKTNISEPGVLVQANDLWVPKKEPAGKLEYEDLASSLGVDLGGWSWGAQFGDLNNDGTLDLYLVNGYISAGERTSYWYDFAQIAVGHSAIISDALNWPAMKGRSLSGYQRKRVWLNDGLGRFTDVAQVVGVTDVQDGRAVALADLTNSGVLDVIVANQRGPLLVYKNTVLPGRHWIDVELEGSASNRSAIGARVELHWNHQVQVQEVSGGSGFSAQNQRRLHYGLGASSEVDRVVIRWPSGQRQTIERPTGRYAAPGQGAPMTHESATLPSTAVVASGRRPIFTIENRFLAPLLITCILVAAHLSFGILEGYERTALAIGTAIAAEAAMGRITFRRWPHPASAYITGISVGILIRSPFFWPYVLASFISIASKYVLRVKGRHLWNPSNFGVSAVLFLAPGTVSLLSIQWGNTLWPMVVIWVLGTVIVWRVGRLHISATYVASFLLFSLIRSALTGNPWLASVAPITGPMYQLFIFFMVTDPKTTVRSKSGQCLVVFLVALVETGLRLAEVVYAPFYALFIVGPAALLLEACLSNPNTLLVGRLRRQKRQ